MSDNWRQQPQYKADVEQADVQVGVVEMLHAVDTIFKGTPMGSPLSLGRTDFEDHDLNAMIDLVEHANPEHLEQASKTLWDARTAIHDAATDLHTNLGQVDWEGEGAEAFHKWTKDLISWTKDLATYADVAATQIDAAATGLASVRKSMPPRDPRPAADQKRPHDLPKAKQVDTNPDYTAAVRAEKHRQEAINQMNRLASFYAVSATALKAAPEPEPLRGMPDVGVPQPPKWVEGGQSSARSGTAASSVAPGHVVEGRHEALTTPHGAEAAASGLAHKTPHEPTAPVTHDIGTEINTVGTLPASAPTVPTAHPAPTLPAAGGGGQFPASFPGPGTPPPIMPTTGRSTGFGGGPVNRLPLSGQGRTGPGSIGSGRGAQGPTAQTGRSPIGGRTPQGPLGQTARATGRTDSPGQSPMGRGVTGGTPRASAPTGRSGAGNPAGPVRNGVVGGKPIAARTPGTAAGPRVPRGMVVGAGESSSSTQPKGQLGGRGVIGSPTAKADPAAGQAALRSARNPNSVVGAPRTKTDTSKDAGKGLGRGAVGADSHDDKRGPSQKKKRRDAPKQSD
ncbi:WXG100 family type VII secretion target [Streptomyces sp. LaPpAH-108]|uniref:WXG100 family type VII secretion target n=1 Tax=Streptomyces sp. LaPpAH-108 TaxID=1155714 RepID=UPI00036DE615|nr:WXG100 family type VII secretion target [Streptomyces sp. LaPpAH-108]